MFPSDYYAAETGNTTKLKFKRRAVNTRPILDT